MIRIDSLSPVRVEGVNRGSIIRSNEIDINYYQQVRSGMERNGICVSNLRDIICKHFRGV